MSDEFDYEELLRRGDGEDEKTFSGDFYRPEPHLIFRETGDSAILRPLQRNADWFRCRTHRFVPVVKPKPSNHEGTWPKSLPATCREEKLLQEKLFGNASCPICEHPAKDKYDKTFRDSVQDIRYTLMVEREQVEGDGSPEMGGPENKGVKGLRDKMVDVPVWTPTGERDGDQTVKLPSIKIVSGTMYQMFSSLKSASETLGDDPRTRDYKVVRAKNPTGRGDLYQWVPMSYIPTIVPGTEHWATYEEAIRLWVPGGLRLAKVVIEKALDAYYERFFTTNGKYIVPENSTSISSGGFAVSNSANPGIGGVDEFRGPMTVPSVNQEVDPDRLAEMRARVLNQQKPAAQGSAS